MYICRSFFFLWLVRAFLFSSSGFLFCFGTMQMRFCLVRFIQLPTLIKFNIYQSTRFFFWLINITGIRWTDFRCLFRFDRSRSLLVTISTEPPPPPPTLRPVLSLCLASHSHFAIVLNRRIFVYIHVLHSLFNECDWDWKQRN